MLSNKKKKTTGGILNKELGSLIFLSALTLNYLLLGLFMFAEVQKRNYQLQSSAGQKVNNKIFASQITPQINVLGETDISLKSLPQNFPPDFPVFHGANLVDEWARESNQLEAVSVIWETNTSPKEVYEYYLMNFKLFGWESEVILESDSSYTVLFQKEKVDGFIGIAASDLDKTIISVIFGVQRE